jgi:hypothetical protein
VGKWLGNPRLKMAMRLVCEGLKACESGFEVCSFTFLVRLPLEVSRFSGLKGRIWSECVKPMGRN